MKSLNFEEVNKIKRKILKKEKDIDDLSSNITRLESLQKMGKLYKRYLFADLRTTTAHSICLWPYG